MLVDVGKSISENFWQSVICVEGVFKYEGLAIFMIVLWCYKKS